MTAQAATIPLVNVVDRFRAWLLSDPRFDALTHDQGLVVLDCLLAMVMADDRITDEEWASLRQEIARLPWAWSEGAGRLDARIEEARLKVERLRPEILDGRFHARVAARLTDPELRREIYRMLVSIALSDGLDDREKAGLDRFRAAFELDQ